MLRVKCLWESQEETSKEAILCVHENISSSHQCLWGRVNHGDKEHIGRDMVRRLRRGFGGTNHSCNWERKTASERNPGKNEAER